MFAVEPENRLLSMGDAGLLLARLKEQSTEASAGLCNSQAGSPEEVEEQRRQEWTWSIIRSR